MQGVGVLGIILVQDEKIASTEARVVGSTMPPGVLLNINVPYLPYAQLKGFMTTRQGQRVYRDVLERRLDPRGMPYYWIGGEAPTGVLENGTDFSALKTGYVSITPLQLDLTALNVLTSMQSWDWTSYIYFLTHLPVSASHWQVSPCAI
jgi:broad specificity polyphosphatase/5'/3'-nucleotidase SurE